MLWWLEEEMVPARSAAVGAKAASLSAMARAGLPVPPGFVLEAAACQAHLEGAGLLAPIAERLRALSPDDMAAMEAACGAIAGRVEAATVPAGVADAVIQAYAELEHRTGERNLRVAVRCSAGAEDLPHETVLGVRGTAALLDAVRHCWAGVWEPGAVAGRLRLNRDQRSAAVAVVVQAMVEADAAGEIAAASGRTDRYLVTAVHGPGESGADPTTFSLTPPQLVELEGLARRADQLFGQPQLLEWALAGRQFWLLQARTAALAGALHGSGPMPSRSKAAWQRVAVRLKAQYPDPPRPFDLSVMEVMRRALHPLMRLHGLRPPTEAMVRELPDGSFVFLPGRVRPGLAALWRWPAGLLRTWRSDPQVLWAGLHEEVKARLDALARPERSAAGLLEQVGTLVALLGEYQERRLAISPTGLLAEAELPGLMPLPSLGARLSEHDLARDESLALMHRMVSSLRRSLLDLGAELTRRGRLARPDEVFYLRLEELGRVVEGALAPAPLVSRRRRAYARTCTAQARGMHWADVGPGA